MESRKALLLLLITLLQLARSFSDDVLPCDHCDETLFTDSPPKLSLVPESARQQELKQAEGVQTQGNTHQFTVSASYHCKYIHASQKRIF